MNSENFYKYSSFVLGFLSLFLMFTFLNLDSSNVEATPTISVDTDKLIVEKVEVFHFHGDRQCSVCKTIGAYSEETINRYFVREVASGKLVYGHINVDDSQNAELTKQYGALGTSLWVGTYDETNFYKENDKAIWYKLGDKEAFILYLKNLIEKRLEGNLN